MSAARPGIPILHEDEHLLVVSKPAGVLVVPAPGRGGPTLVDLLQRARGERLYPVHRLDEDTTGVLVVARTPEAKVALEGLFERHDLERIYLALVERMPNPPAGRIESRLAEDEQGVMRSVLRGGERAVTHYRALARRGRHVLIECRLETGRRNQIRAHLKELGTPIVGDRKYGYRASPGVRVRRPLLHAYSIRFLHPMTGVILVAQDEPEEKDLSMPRG